MSVSDTNDHVGRVPPPLTLMKRCKRMLDFDDHGRPLHPLHVDIRTPLKNSGVDKGLDWGSNKEELAYVRCGGQVMLVKRGRRWAFPSIDNAREALGKGVLNKGKVVYDNMDNFAQSAGMHAWVETKITRFDVDDVIGVHSGEAKWLPVDTKNVYPLHRLLLDGE